jgi:hypothetical protein
MIRPRAALAGFALALALLAPAHASAAPGRHALLVGVTDYPQLDRSLWLDGGANDVLLMERLLREKFSFPRENIVILSEAEGRRDGSRAPTRRHIERECLRLAKLAQEGDRVVVFLSGHGSLQPEKEGLPDPSPDGLERIFLPRDASRWTRTDGAVNAISGRELGEWLRPVPLRKALLWVIVDTCHSGQMLRGVNERVRQVDAQRGLGVPRQVMDNARQRARRAAERPTAASAFVGRLAHLEGVALLYACEGHEVTVEKNFPPESDSGRPYGLMTWTLNRILASASAPLTYRELTRRIQNEYAAMDRTFPTPLIEGRGRDRTVLQSKKLNRLPIVLSRRDDVLTVNAGQLHGLTAGSVLAVYPPAGQKGERRGYVRIRRVEATRAQVAPWAPAGRPAARAEDLIGGRCELAVIDFGDMKLRLAVDRLASRPREEAAEDRRQLQRDLDDLARDLHALARLPDSPFVLVASQQQAEWLVRLAGGKAYLVRSAEFEDGRAPDGVPAAARQKALQRLLGPFERGAQGTALLREGLARIARAANLLKLAARPAGEIVRGSADEAPRARVEVVRLGGKPEAPSSDPIPRFCAGDRVELRVSNTGRVPIDVTVLYVDSQFGIEALFPLAEHNRLSPGSTVRVPPVDVKGHTSGREHVVLVAVRARELEPVDFVSLAQPSLQRAVTTDRSRGGSRGLGSPLGRLLQKALYRSGKTRGMSAPEAEDYFLQLVPVQVEARKR